MLGTLIVAHLGLRASLGAPKPTWITNLGKRAKEYIDLCGRFSRLCNRLHLSSVDLIGKMLVAFSYFAQVYIVLFKPLAGQQSEALENRQAIFI